MRFKYGIISEFGHAGIAGYLGLFSLDGVMIIRNDVV